MAGDEGGGGGGGGEGGGGRGGGVDGLDEEEAANAKTKGNETKEILGQRKIVWERGVFFFLFQPNGKIFIF